VGEEFREILAEEVLRLKDPRVGFVTIVGVRVTPDLRHARVAYTAMGDAAAKAGSRAALRSATKHLRHELGRQVHLKVTPELEFVEDDTFEHGQRIDAVLEAIQQEGDDGDR
jgi:ribosome-binding factor A